MNWLDVFILLPVLYGLIRGFMRGFVSEVIAFAVVIFGALGARLIAPPVSGAIRSAFNWDEGTCDVIAYVVVFIVVAVILSLLAKQANRFVHAIHMAWLNSVLGGVFGALKACLLVLIVVFVFERTNEEYHYLDNAPIIQKSTLYPKASEATHVLFSFSREQLGEL
jgi:membrane protein required for colicin V production